MAYTIIIGFPASAVRAVVMAWLAMFATYLGRLSSASSAVFFAAGCMVFANPLILRDDVGFQLSVAAILGLIYLGPLFDRIVGERYAHGALYEATRTTLAAQLATLPLITWYFGNVSLIAPIVNIICVPIAALITMAGLVMLCVFFIPLPIADALSIVINVLLTAMIEIIRLFSRVPYASISM